MTGFSFGEIAGNYYHGTDNAYHGLIYNGTITSLDGPRRLAYRGRDQRLWRGCWRL
jgi:hypothetical protein